MEYDSILAIFKPDFVFSLAFIAGFIGLGRFVDGSLFPWFKEYMQQRSVLEEAELKRNDQLFEILTAFKAELSAFRETHSIILAYIISDLTSNEPEKDTDTAAARALKKRQTTQDLLLRRLEGSSPSKET